MGVLILNAGSSSLKFDFFPAPHSQPTISQTIELDSDSPDLERVVSGALASVDLPAVEAVGHRIVHGGETYRTSTEIDDTVTSDLAALSHLAPLHLPPILSAIDQARHLLPHVPHIGVFDTAFFADLPPCASIYPLPFEWHETHQIRRFGFHGISHEYCAQRANELDAGKRIIICHLGSGCSLSAIFEDKPIATTMGFTPLDGVMMGTRPGAIDPGILIHLLQSGAFGLEALEHALNHRSGLQGVSGVSSDIRQIQDQAHSGNERAQLALDLFYGSISSAIAALATKMGGVDSLIFTAGIGENSPTTRAKIGSQLEWLGCTIDSEKNAHAQPDCDISSAASTIKTWVIKTQENAQIAQKVWSLTNG